MEIKNNLISRTDIGSISKSKKIHQLKIQQYQQYKIISDKINQPNVNIDYGFINTVTNAKFQLEEHELLELSDATIKYYDDQSANTPGKNVPVFIPLVETVQFHSNPKLVISFPDSIRFTSANDYNFTCGDDLIEKCSYKYLDLIRNKLEIPEKRPLTLVVFYRCDKDKNLIVKFQILEILVTKQANIATAKLYQKKVPCDGKVYIEKYDDWYIATSNASMPKWLIQIVYQSKIGDNKRLGTSRITLDKFKENHPKLPLVLSVNYHKGSDFLKREISSPFDLDEYIEENDNSEKVQLFIDHPKARYYDILLRYLPEEYKTDKTMWRELIKSCKHSTYKLLFREYSQLFADEFDKEWESKDNVERIPMGYYHQICATNPQFVAELEHFLMEYIETLFYQTNFKIIPKDAAEILRIMTYGRFYYAPDKKKKDSKWWYFVYEEMDSAPGSIYKWRECEDLAVMFMPLVYEDFYNLIDKVKKKIDATMEQNKAKEKLMAKIESYSDKIGTSGYPLDILKILPSYTKIPWLSKRIDSYADILGVLNGVIDLRVAHNKPLSPEPIFITGYSKYFITKSTRANYRPFNKNDPACKIWLDILKDTTPEKDARMVKWFLYSTGLDQACRVNSAFQIVGNGSNGKSVEIDNVMEVLGEDYSVKLSSNLLMGKNKPGQADNDLMQMKGKNIGFISETDQNDVLIASRLKTLNESIKTGRKNYSDAENFRTNCTVIVATNFALNIEDTDYGTFRRTMVYHQPFKYVEKPNPKYPEEKLKNRKYEKLAEDNQELADGLLACLIHKRIKFHHKYNSEIERVPMPTIERYTNQYRVEQNGIMGFLSIKLVLLYGYDKTGIRRDDVTEAEIAKYYIDNNVTYEETISIDLIINAYREWYKNVGTLTKNNDIIKREFKESMLGKYLREHDGGRVVELSGYRIIESGKRKLPNEEYFM